MQNPLTFDKGIKAGQKKNWRGTLEYNRFLDDARKFKDTELENMKFEWKPEAIIFADGNKVGAEAEEQEAKRVAEEAAKKEAQVAAELSNHILIAPFNKSFHKADWRNREYEDIIAIDFVFENKSDKDIKAFKGVTVFKDLFGEVIMQIPFTHDEGIKAGQKKNWCGAFRYNQFMDNARKFKDTDLENMKFEWKPKSIIFADGSKVGMEN